jgi:hypothetical protein
MHLVPRLRGEHPARHLPELRRRARQAPRPPAPSAAITALASRNPEPGTIAFVLDADTASIALFAFAACAGECEARIREVQQYGQSLPVGSYSRRTARP